MRVIQANLTEINKRNARTKFDEGVQILSVGENDGRIFVEYTRSTETINPEIIIFEKDNDEIRAWHECSAKKSNYSKGCYHLGFATVIYADNSISQINIMGAPNQFWVKKDLTEKYLSRKGQFRKLELKPDGGGPDRIISETTVSFDITDEDTILLKYNLPERLLKSLIKFREEQRKRLTIFEKQMIPNGVDYIAQGKEVVYALASLLYGNDWAAPLLIGPKGTGKSTLAELIAELLYLPILKIAGSIDVNQDYLIGSKTLDYSTGSIDLLAKIGVACEMADMPLTPEEINTLQGINGKMRVVHEAGPVMQAAQRGYLLFADEVNIMPAEITSILHPLIDWQRTLTVPGVGEVKAHPHFRMIAAMNERYMGTRPLNDGFRDRFRGIQIKGINKDSLICLLSEKVKLDTANKLATIYQDLFDSVYSPKGATMSEKCISIRAIMRAANEISMGIDSEREIIKSCLTEGLENDSERIQVTDLIEARL